MYTQEMCSHIINIYSKQENPPHDKGNLYLSGVNVFNKPDLLTSRKINCVFSILQKFKYDNAKVQQKLQHLQINNTKWIDLQDYQSVSIYPHLEEAHSYIKSMLLNHNVLVHCQMGKSRSASFVIAFLMREYGMNYEEAHIFAKNKRRFVKPNEGFQRELLKYEEQLRENHPDLFKK